MGRMNSMNKKVALITGSSRGIGKEIAKEFLRENYAVILNGRSQSEALTQAFAECKAISPDVYMIPKDISCYEQATQLFEEIHQTHAQVDVLVNNAAVSYVGLFNQMKPEEWNDVMHTNVNGVYNCTYHAVQKMIGQQQGCILNISSIWGTTGASCEAVYAASKGAVNAFTKSLAKELGPTGIRVNAISCGVIETEMNAWLDEEERAGLTDDIPLMRFGTPSEVAALAVFLASPKASYISGQILTVDGAYTCM